LTEGRAIVGVPDTGDALMTIDEANGIGSVTYFGVETPTGPGLPLVGFTADTGAGICTVFVDELQRPVHIALGATIIDITYNPDGSFNYELNHENELLYGGNDVVIEPPDTAKIRMRAQVSRATIQNCILQEYESAARIAISIKEGGEPDSVTGHPFYECVESNEQLGELARTGCVVKLVLLTRLANLSEKCARLILPPPECERLEEIAAATGRALDKLKAVTAGVITDVLGQIAFDPACWPDDGAGDGSSDVLIRSAIITVVNTTEYNLYFTWDNVDGGSGSGFVAPGWEASFRWYAPPGQTSARCELQASAWESSTPIVWSEEVWLTEAGFRWVLTTPP
jgi:hypothetical protein